MPSRNQTVALSKTLMETAPANRTKTLQMQRKPVWKQTPWYFQLMYLKFRSCLAVLIVNSTQSLNYLFHFSVFAVALVTQSRI